MALIRGVRLAMRAASSEAPVFHGTTILCVRKAGETVMIGDGQVTLGSQVIKGNARKLRRLREGRIVAGFAGATADAMTLMERLEEKLDEHSGQLLRSCVDLAAAWRTDKYLRRLEAMMLVADQKHMLTLTGSGDVLEPQNSVMAIGSGGGFAYAAALALTKNGDLPAEEIAKKAMEIAAEMCVYTNDSFIVEKISSDSSE